MTDLTKITEPFGLLDKKTQDALEAHGGPYQNWCGDMWNDQDGLYEDSPLVQRVKPNPLTKPSIDWSQLPEWVQAIARDANGHTWAYAREPKRHVSEWAGGGRFARVDEVHASLNPGTCPWDESLVMRPE